MKVTTWIVLFVACAAFGGWPVIASARDQCSGNDTSCRMRRFYESPVRKGSGTDFRLEREREIRSRRDNRNRDRGNNYSLPSPADVRPCQTRPIISGQGTRVVPTC